MRNEQSCRIARLWVDDDGICRIVHEPDAEVSLADAREAVAILKEICNGRRLPFLIDSKTVRSISREARELYAGDEVGAVASAVAILVGTPVSRVLGNFYIGLSNPQMPCRLFTGTDEALAWLEDFRE